MNRSTFLAGAVCLALGGAGIPGSEAQTARVIPRPPAQAPGPPNPAGRQRGARRLCADSGMAGADPGAEAGEDRRVRCRDGRRRSDRRVLFHFLPDGRIIVGERPGRIKIVGRDGKVSEPIEGLPSNLWARGQGLFEVRPDRAFATNRTIYLTYTVLPEAIESSRAAAQLLACSWSRARNCPPTTNGSRI